MDNNIEHLLKCIKARESMINNSDSQENKKTLEESKKFLYMSIENGMDEEEALIKYERSLQLIHNSSYGYNGWKI